MAGSRSNRGLNFDEGVHLQPSYGPVGGTVSVSLLQTQPVLCVHCLDFCPRTVRRPLRERCKPGHLRLALRPRLLSLVAVEPRRTYEMTLSAPQDELHRGNSDWEATPLDPPPLVGQPSLTHTIRRSTSGRSASGRTPCKDQPRCRGAPRGDVVDRSPIVAQLLCAALCSHARHLRPRDMSALLQGRTKGW